MSWTSWEQASKHHGQIFVASTHDNHETSTPSICIHLMIHTLKCLNCIHQATLAYTTLNKIIYSHTSTMCMEQEVDKFFVHCLEDTCQDEFSKVASLCLH